MHLLDVNTLIALAWEGHEHHAAAHVWFRTNASAGFATCHVTQSGFVRLSLNRKVVGRAISCSEILQKLNSFTNNPSHVFWEDRPLEVSDTIWASVTGHNQVTDTNLFLIAKRNQGKLITFDGAIRNRVAQDEQNWVEVLGG